MTAPEKLSLPDALMALSKLIPERLNIVMEKDDNGVETGWGMVQVLWRGHWRIVQEVVPPSGEWNMPWEFDFALEPVLREECEARGWNWTIQARRPLGGVVYDAVVSIEPWHGRFGGNGSTPAHAFSLALLAALGGQK